MVDAVLDVVARGRTTTAVAVGSSVGIKRISLLVLLDDWMTIQSSDCVVADADEEPLVGLLEHEHVVARACGVPSAWRHTAVRAFLVVGGDVEEP